IMNPAILNSPTGADSQQVDVNFSIVNEGNATTAYNLNLNAPELAGLDYQLMVYRLNETPIAQGCTLTTEAQQQLLFNQTDPLNNDIDGTFYLEPGQEVQVTFRVLPDTTSPTPADPTTDFDVNDIGGQVVAQPTNSTAVSDPPPSDDFGVPPPPPPPTVTIADVSPNPMAPGFGQLTNFTIVGGPPPVFGTDTVWARNEVTGVERSTNFVFAGSTTIRLDGDLRPPLGSPDQAGTVWIEYFSGDRSNDFPMTFRDTPVAPTITGVFTAPAATGATSTSCVDFSGSPIGPGDTVLGGDWVRIEALGLDTNTSRVNVLTTQSSSGTSSTGGLCPATSGGASGFSYFVQIPAGVTADSFTLQIRANQSNVGGGAGDYAAVGFNSPATLTNVSLSSTTLTIGGPAATYTADLVNNSGSPLSTVSLQGYVEQGSAIRAAGGLLACSFSGVLPVGGCSDGFSLLASNSTAGSGTLVAGPATARIDLILNGTVISTFTAPITLVP
nr:hypothetical protein [Woeseiaceae bacterium]